MEERGGKYLDLWADPPENLKGDVIREQLLSILRKLH
jgi:hypothetical protein